MEELKLEVKKLEHRETKQMCQNTGDACGTSGTGECCNSGCCS